MEAILETLGGHPGLYAFLLLLACGLGLPPWSEELVLLASGYMVAEGHLSFTAATAWCSAGIVLGDATLFLTGRLAGERVARWPILRKAMRPARRRRFNAQFLKYGTRVVFLARFLPGVRMLTYLVAGNLGMPWWKFLVLDGLGMLLTVPTSIWLGWKFSSNLDLVLEWSHRLQIPLAILAVLACVWVFRRWRRSRWAQLQSLRQQRRERDGIS
jgi:membrane protein DedA with SNARE-associated domain